MTVTYDEKDLQAINFAKWILEHNLIELRAMEYTVEELYQSYLKQL